MSTTDVTRDERVRLRRALSVTKAQEISEKQKKERQAQPDQPCHVPRDSLLSSSSGYTNYRGLLNLCIVLLILSNSRVALENIIKYGILVDPIQILKIFVHRPSKSPTVLLLLGLNIFILGSLLIELMMAKEKIKEEKGRLITVAHLSALIVLPPIFVYILDCHPVAASILMGEVSIIFLKLVSYHMVNYWCRKSQKTITNRTRGRSYTAVGESIDYLNGDSSDSKSSLVHYPDNLTVKDLYYFMFAPTLCYELNFPRSDRIRKRFLIKRLLEMFILIQVILALIQQWMVPIVNNSFKPLQEMKISHVIERLLKLAVPNHFIWLLFFYWLFHSCLNSFAEILRFADRQFYRDWWNAESINQFWRNWNIPVHQWCVRHLYKPLLVQGFSKLQANIAVFVVSAFFHEYLVSFPLKMFRSWAFFGMLSQVPFALVISRYLHKDYGNMAVWVSLIIGQPLCILAYYHDYYVIHYNETTT
ncbi:diacylglycerol O-acyltransferase 1-like [Centruroides sculpturatus]|uniref:diacylglycerol O-acyltransferase 1-like n=1 Tax=Centruroides sculpturatus TaxID=218467 RepID=UPI000C6EB84C|nr:diacylglycerol O-acyltransferase 1-like [Centruroides sculpturatus]